MVRRDLENYFLSIEMNMHGPQNVMAETELKHLAATVQQIITPASNSPIIGMYQDSLLGAYRFTREKIDLTPRQAMNLLMAYKNIDIDALLSLEGKITNFDVLSQIMPHITLTIKNKLIGENEDFATTNNVMEIRNGKYVRGHMEKSVLGSTTNGIIHRAFNDFGPDRAAAFIDDLQAIVTEYMKTSSYSVGISDLLADKNTMTQITSTIATQKMEAKKLMDSVHLGIFKNETANSNAAEFENQITNIMKKADNDAGKIGSKSLSKNNRFLMIVNSGSKGNMINISQMISCLGQQAVEGKRIPYGLDSRTLPHYFKYDDSPGARGYIENSYISGLTAPELFFHAMGGRIGLIDTAVKTSSTGYIQRRLIKGLEDLKVEYDMTVRNSNGKIVQFAYGDDGFDSTKVENQQIPLAGMSVEDVYMMYDIARITDKERGSKDIYTPAIVNKIRGEVEETRKKCRQYIDRMLADREELVKNVFKYKDDAGVRVPVAFKHIINNVAGSMGLDAHSMVDITPLETFIMVEEYFHKLEKLHYVRPTNLFRIMYYFYLNPRDLLCVKRYNKAALLVLLETIVLKYKQAVVNPGDMVGVIAGQSIGEPTTQLTLNSFVYETEILVRNAKGEIKCVQIGDFAKWGIDTSRKIEYMDAKDTTYAELCEFYEVPSATEDGRTVWRRIEAVTKHPVINEDGTNTMLKVTTKGQREIIATKAKSFLQLVDGKIVGVNGSELQVGDYLPVSKKALDFTERNSFDLREILSPKEYIYGTEMEKARSHMHEYHWWMKHAGKSFVLPYARSDSAYSALNGGHNKGYKTQFVYKPGCVYTTTNSIGNYEIPETMPLDYDFGYLIGAYCAEGCMTKHQVSIANNVNEYLAPIERWCAKHNLTTKIYCHKNKIQEGWTSQDIRIYNTVLCRILDKLCGKLSHNKFVSDIIMFSNRECILGFLDAYISGDGCVNKVRGRVTDISVGSVSHRMLTQVQVMMKNIGVLGKMYKCTKRESNNRGSKDIKQGYMLRVTNKQAQILGSLLNLSIDYKRERIAELLTQDFKYDYCGSDLQIPNIINGETIMQERDGRCSDLEFDQIISIEEVPNTTPYAYDLTVEDTRNFDCMNGLCGRDTFHHSGVASKSNVTRGVPRIEEILNLTKSQKSTSLTVHLKPMDEQHMDRAVKYAKMLEHTKLADVVKSMQICFDPAEDDTRIADDREFMRQFIEFERMMEECGAETSMSEKSKWVLRMEMDEETMLDKNITMDDVHFALKNSTLGQDITCSYSDYNSDKLVFRIRSSTFGQSKKKTKNAPASLDLSDDISMLRSYQDLILNSVVLRGVTGIVNVLPRKLQNMVDKEDGKYVRKDMWVLDTTGTNLLDTLALDYIDPYRTYSNDIKEVFDVLGIDAARQTIFDEMTDVMEASDVYINYHHLSLLCDRMTLTKGMVSIYRTGILSDDIGPVAKSTFEVHTKVLLDAARRAEFDHIRGVSANVMCGQQGLYGTNAFQVVLDMKAMSKIEDTMVDVQTDDVEKMMAEMGLGTEDGCVSKIKNNIKYLNRENTGECDDNYDMGF